MAAEPVKPMADVARAPALPSRLGRYELLHPIGSGGMASVYLGRARGAGGFERIVAVKVCHAHLREDEAFAAMFLDEARLAARIHHPNVVATLDVDEGEALYLVMEYVEGGRLAELTRAARGGGDGRLPLPVLLRIMSDALAGLHAAHELRGPDGTPLELVHRDFSPQNILVGVDGLTRIADFGIAKALSRATVTRDGEIKGKLSYMAPEQLALRQATRRSDVFAAGVVMWEAVTGQRLFQGDSEVETASLLMSAPIAPPSHHRPSIPAALDAAIVKALARNPAQRFATAAEFAEALERVGPVAAPREVGACVRALLDERIAQRREVLRALESPAAARATTAPAAAELPPTATAVEASTVTSTGVRRAGRRWPAALLGGLVVAAGLGAGAFALRVPSSPAASAHPAAATPPALPRDEAAPPPPPLPSPSAPAPAAAPPPADAAPQATPRGAPSTRPRPRTRPRPPAGSHEVRLRSI